MAALVLEGIESDSAAVVEDDLIEAAGEVGVNGEASAEESSAVEPVSAGTAPSVDSWRDA